jgi:hypothetical protein
MPDDQMLAWLARNGDAGMEAATIVYDSGVDLLEQSIEDLRDTPARRKTPAPERQGLSTASGEEDRS